MLSDNYENRKVLMSIILICSILVTPLSGFAVTKSTLTDGSEVPLMSAQKNVVDFDSYSVILNAGAMPMEIYPFDGRYSAYWIQSQSNQIRFVDVARDWSVYDMIEIRLYSEKATNTMINFVIYCDEIRDSKPNTYCRAGIMLDWEGWKTFRFRFYDTTGINRTNDALLSKVRSIMFSATGWDATVHPEARLYISSLQLLKGGLDGSVKINYESDKISDAYTIMENAVSVYAGSPNVIDKGTMRFLNGNTDAIRTQIDSGTVLVPIAFFEDFLGASVSENDGNYDITLSGNTLLADIGEVSYTLNSAPGTFDVHPRRIDDTVYFPVAQCAEALGLNIVAEGKLVVMSEDTAIDALKTYGTLNELTEIVAYRTAYVPADLNSLTSEDFLRVKNNLRRLLVGDHTVDQENPHIRSRYTAIESDGNKTWENLRKGDEIADLFNDKVITTEAELVTNYNNIYKMALAYAAPGTELYRNEALRDDIIYALDWLYQRYYGPLSIRYISPIKVTNWYHWVIAIPRHIVRTLLLLEGDIPQSEIEKYLAVIEVYTPNTYGRGNGSNQLNNAMILIGGALLREDAVRLIQWINQTDLAYLFVDTGRNSGWGFYTDGSYVLHRRHAMNGSYGAEHLKLGAELYAVLSGTSFELLTPEVHNIVDWIYEGFEPFIYKGQIMRMVRGRTANSGHDTSKTMVDAALKILDAVSEEDARRLKSLIKYTVVTDSGNNYYSTLSFTEISRLGEIMSDDTVEIRQDYILNRVYSNMDKVVHQNGNWAMGISMSSSRIYNYEAFQNSNLTGWYLGDGMVNILNDDVNQYNTTYWNHVNPYRLPGTTVHTKPRQAANIRTEEEYLSSQDFVGGATLDDTYGVAAMWLESFHKEGGVDDATSNPSQGGPHPNYESTLMAQKAWFMFDDEVVALGAGIESENDGEILTIIENRKLNNVRPADTQDDFSQQHEVKSVWASQVPEQENVPENTIDGFLGTKWAATGNASIIWDLGDVETVGYIGLSFENGNRRQQLFDLSVSEDGEAWTKVYGGRSSGKTALAESYSLADSQARYIRLDSFGNTTNTWISLTGAEIHPPNPDGSIRILETNYIGGEKVTVDGMERDDINDSPVALTDVNWVHLEETGGYYFPEGGSVNALKTVSHTSFFELWMTHGENPDDETYAYVMLPNMSAEETATYAQNPDIDILINNRSIQAVRENKLGVTGIVFWEAGSFAGITASAPMIVIIREDGENFKISISDPTHKLDQATVVIHKDLTLISGDDKVSVSNGDVTTLTADFKNLRGKSITASFLD